MSEQPDLHRILTRVFGYPDFRGPQLEIIEKVMAGKSVLAILPTGFGKSLCFQLPARALRANGAGGLVGPTVLVISPLIALMKDQVDQAQAKGLKAAFINSSLSGDERFKRQKKLSAGQFELCYVTPERFRKDEFWAALAGVSISFVAVDEAHCIAEWGHDFRPDYSRLQEILARLALVQGRAIPVLALTATATPEVQAEIQTQLGFDHSSMPVVTADLARPNLGLEVWEMANADQKIQAILALKHQYPGPMIVYASLIDTLKRLSRALHKLNVPNILYHGDLNDRERRQNQDAFFKSETPDSQLMLATPAFGLGVDKADIRAVVHVEFPRSLEAYFQEAGRGGRDGKPTVAALLFDEDDAFIQMDFIKWANPDPDFVGGVFNLIRANEDRVAQEGFDYLREQMNFHNRRDFRVETAVQFLERWGAIEYDLVAEHNRTVNPRGRLKAVQKLDSNLLNEIKHAERLKHQNQKLLSVIQYAKNKAECRQQMILIYLGQTDAGRCLICDVCLKLAREEMPL